MLAVAVMVPVSRRSDRRLERRWHIATSAIGGSAGLWASIFVTHNPLLAVLAMSVATTGIITALPLFWSLPNARLTGVAAAAGLAVINSIGNLAGFVSPYLVGLLSTATHDTRAGVAMMACSMLVGAALTLSLPAEPRRSETSAAQ
jgi:MFS-type transporter involved in bile tolerance (Atg22 family)